MFVILGWNIYVIIYMLYIYICDFLCQTRKDDHWKGPAFYKNCKLSFALTFSILASKKEWKLISAEHPVGKLVHFAKVS